MNQGKQRSFKIGPGNTNIMNENVDYGEKGCYWEIANKSVMIGEQSHLRLLA